MSKNPKVDAFLHKLFGTTPGEGMQPKEAIAYSVAGFGQNFICTIIGSYLTVFMTDALGFDLNTKIGVMSGVMAVAWLMLGTRIFDAFNDPIMGSIVDRTRTKWGKCRPYLKWMAIPIGVVTILCFLPWYPKTGGGFAALSVIYVIWSVVYTVADVPYWGLSSAMTNNTDSRGKMLTVARLACTLGAGIVTVFVPIITSAVTAEYKYNELAVQTPVIVYQINDVNDSTKNIYVFDTEMQKAYFNDGDIKEGNLTEAEKAAGFKYGRTVIYDDKGDPKYLNIKFKKNGDIKSVEVKEEYYKQKPRKRSFKDGMCGRKPENLALYLLHRGDSACRACDADVLLWFQKHQRKIRCCGRRQSPDARTQHRVAVQKQTFVAPCSFGYPWRRENGLYVYGRFVLL